MRNLRLFTAALMLVCCGATPALAEGAGIEWDILNQEVNELRRTGKYDRGVVVAKKALEVAETSVGVDHPDVATSLNNLAGLYDTQGQYASAEPLYKRSLAIKEKALGPDHPSMAASLNNLPRSSIQRSLLRRAMPGGGVNGSRPTISIASSRG